MRLHYTCNPDVPLHYAVAVKKFGYKTTGYFENYFGGINAFTKDQFLNINGFSNLFFGWGGEDDDALIRSVFKYQRIARMPANIARYYTDDHKQDNDPNPSRWRLLKHARMLMHEHGLNSLKYNVIDMKKDALFTKVIVNYNILDYLKVLNNLPL